MSRIARVVIPGCPHHVIQRGNRRQKVFFSDQDKRAYITILRKTTERYGIQIWAYCLMDNHVHLVAVPETEESLARGIGETHKKYTNIINLREGWKGYLWQGRFLSYPLDEKYLYSVVRYVERNPVRAGLVQKPEDYRWSSAMAHIFCTQDPLVSGSFLNSHINDWAAYLSECEDPMLMDMFTKHACTGKPLGFKFPVDE